MTTSIIIRSEKKLYFGCDKRITYDSLIYESDLVDKTYVSENIILVFAGSTYHFSLLKMVANEIKFTNINNPRECFYQYVNAVEEQFSKIERIESLMDLDNDSDVYVIIGGKIFEMFLKNNRYDYSFEPTQTILVTGSGVEIARGMWLYLNSINTHPREILKMILSEIPKIDNSTGGGGIIYEYDLENFKTKKIENW